MYENVHFMALYEKIMTASTKGNFVSLRLVSVRERRTWDAYRIPEVIWILLQSGCYGYYNDFGNTWLLSFLLGRGLNHIISVDCT